MIYLLDKFDLDLIKIDSTKYHYITFCFWECPATKVANWLRYERSRSTLSKKEIIQIFNIDYPIQMVQVDEITIRQYDKIIIWTPEDRYFVFEATDFTK